MVEMNYTDSFMTIVAIPIFIVYTLHVWDQIQYVQFTYIVAIISQTVNASQVQILYILNLKFFLRLPLAKISISSSFFNITNTYIFVTAILSCV